MSTELELLLWKKEGKSSRLWQVQQLEYDKGVCGVTTQRWEQRTLGQNVDAFDKDAQMLVSKY
jgi:hypothetical protein